VKIILQAITGSHAYGLNTPDSDIDRNGVFVLPTAGLLQITPPTETIVTAKPDSTLHEVGKFIRLALKCNPSIIELLYMEQYETLTWEGLLLINRRDCFLSTPYVRDAFGGYAIQQLHRLLNRNAEGKEGFSSQTIHRTEKHARHCFRLLRQGAELLRTGHLTVRLENPEEYFAIGKMVPAELKIKFEEEFARFKEIDSVLPNQPDRESIELVLAKIRRAHYA
jgi:predicted nucleotidyltransferase